MTYSIATWNINSVRLRADLVGSFLEEHQPDVLCLQEIKCQNDQFPEKAFKKLGYEHIAVNGQKGYHGVATISRHPIEESAVIDFCDVGDSRHIRTVHSFGGKQFSLHNFYVPAGGDEADVDKNPKFAHKLKFLDEMRALGPEDYGHDNVLVGDLNIAPHENDVWSHKQLLKVVSHTPVETETLDSIRDDAGWVDLIRQKVPYGERLYTWWSYRSKDWNAADKGRRLDHIWSSDGMSEQLSDIKVLRDARGWEKPSDHVPVIAEFKA